MCNNDDRYALNYFSNLRNMKEEHKSDIEDSETPYVLLHEDAYNGNNIKNEEIPHTEHFEEPGDFVNEDSVHLDNGCYIKIEETDIKAECFNGEVKDSLNNYSLKEITRDYANHIELTESCSSRQNETVNPAITKEQMYFERAKVISNLANERCITDKFNDKSYQCDVCNKLFTVASVLAKHKRFHSVDTPFICDVCNKGFKQSSDLVKHKRTHTGDKPFVCDVCNKGFAISKILKEHKRCHTGEKPFSCDVCNKKFTQSGHLITHKRLHTGEKPFICDFCNKGFTHSSDLTKHKSTHTAEKTFFCDVCNKKFKQSNSLRRHKLIH